MRLILASTSSYRRMLVGRLGLRCESIDPAVEEPVIADEPPRDRARRLARSKAGAVAARSPDAVVIGSDQVACCDHQILHKPGTAAAQIEQLMFAQGRELQFFTAICVMHAGRGQMFEHVDQTDCRMRALDRDAIERYVAAEPAWDCAGGFKAEGLGIVLFKHIRSEDPSALIGLPLIALASGLIHCGLTLP